MTKKHTAIIVLGGGKGERFGSLKQFTKIKGKPLLRIVVDMLLEYRISSTVVLVVPKANVSATKQMYKNNSEVVVLSGGGSRFESTKIALDYLSEKKYQFVFIHDAVRPFVRKLDFLSLYKTMIKESTEGAVLFLPVTDAVVSFGAKGQVEHLDNNLLRATQTPHLYRYKSLAETFASTAEKVENAELMETAGHKLSYVLGSRFNIKITHKTDMPLFKYWSL